MTSAAILYSGSLPTKALQIFTILNCANISVRTFFRHQKLYLQPAVISTWERHQQAIFTTLKDVKLTLSGDGRADSPGHSAKYGSYSVIELSNNIVVDFQLVQVRKYMYKKVVFYVVVSSTNSPFCHIIYAE